MISPIRGPDLASTIGGLPNPRTLAQKLFTRSKQQTVFAPQQNLISAAWIQFQTHDWFQHVNSVDPKETINVPIELGDPLWKLFSKNVMSVSKTQADPTANGQVPMTFQNNMTHWWDLSQVYGTDESLLAQMRSHQSGKLIMDANNLVPLGPKGIEVTGATPNWWIGLSLMHNLFARNHNSICDQLVAAYPSMSDEQLFQTARLVNAATSAKIHTTEWTPALLANEYLFVGMNANWRGADFISYPPLVGNPNPDPVNVTYQMPEEFVSIYRMHPLLPEQIPYQPIGTNAPTTNFPLTSTAFGGSGILRSKYSVANLLNSFGTNLMGALKLNNHPSALTNLQLPTGQTVDVSMLDILRDRERGVPRYNAYRALMNLPPKELFSDITSDSALAAELAFLYGGDIDAVDLLVGSLAEDVRPSGYAFSETTFRLFSIVASRRLSADR
ncbi:hypothetical protein HDU98_001740 [Podochytrium sp. JEL0797]|nr:hypothetical protein HDU98_001740 [Podochytrium sp. JEL0797]